MNLKTFFTVKSTILYLSLFQSLITITACKLESDSRTEHLIFNPFPLQAVQILFNLQGASL